MLDDQIEATFGDLPADSLTAAFLDWSYRASDGPQIFSLAAFLATLSMAHDPHTTVWLGTQTNACFWTLCVGDSGTRKTSKMRHAIGLLRDVMPDLLLDEPQSDAALYQDLARAGEKGLLFLGEMETFFTSTSKGAYRETVASAAMSLWDGGPRSTSGVKRGVVALEAPQFTLAGAAALGVLEENTDESTWTRGFLPRFAIFASKSTRDLPSPEAQPQIRLRLIERLTTLFTQPIGPFEGLSADATALYEDWYTRSQQVARQSPHRWLPGVYSRLATVAVKAALSFSLDFGAAGRSYGDPWELDAASMYFGTHVANMHADSVCWLISQLATTPFERERRSVLAVADQHPRNLQYFLGTTSPKLSKRRMESVLDTLVAEGTLYLFEGPDPQWATEPAPPTRGVPTGSRGLW